MGPGVAVSDAVGVYVAVLVGVSVLVLVGPLVAVSVAVNEGGGRGLGELVGKTKIGVAVRINGWREGVIANGLGPLVTGLIPLQEESDVTNRSNNNDFFFMSSLHCLNCTLKFAR